MCPQDWAQNTFRSEMHLNDSKNEEYWEWSTWLLMTRNLFEIVEGQVLDDSKNTIITKEEDEFVNFISYLTISIHDSVKSIN